MNSVENPKSPTIAFRALSLVFQTLCIAFRLAFLIEIHEEEIGYTLAAGFIISPILAIIFASINLKKGPGKVLDKIIFGTSILLFLGMAVTVIHFLMNFKLNLNLRFF